MMARTAPHAVILAVAALTAAVCARAVAVLERASASAHARRLPMPDTSFVNAFVIRLHLFNHGCPVEGSGSVPQPLQAGRATHGG